MAYLRGTTVVDGSLYVEGELNVKSVRSGDNSIFPYIPEGYGKQGHLVKFSGVPDGEQVDSYLKETVKTDSSTGETSVEFDIIDKDGAITPIKVSLNYEVKKIGIVSSELKPVGSTLDKPEAITGWEY